MRAPSLVVLVLAGCTVGPDQPALPGPDGGVAADPDERALQPLVANREKTAFDYFVAKGLTPVQAAGIVGNLTRSRA